MNRQLRAWLIVASASLTALSSIRTVNAQQVAPARRVWAGPVVDALKFFPSPSPDGRLLAYADAHTGELTLREIATGETRQLTDGSWDKGKNAFASWTAFSRDGKQIAYGWYNDSNPSYELRIIGIDGGAPRVVRHPLDKRGARPADWTPDGRYVVAVTTGDAQTAQLELVPAAGGPPRLLKSFPDWRRPKQVRVSPDGKYVAYDCPARKDAMERDIFLLALDGSRETTAIKWPGDVHFVGWTNDGRLTFTSDKAGSPAIWTVRVENGRPVGEPSLVTKDLWRSSGFDLAAQGSYFYVVETGDRDVFTAAFDPVVGKLLSKPLGLTHSPGEGYGGVAYSRDGRSVAYLSYRAPRMSYSAYSLVGDATITIQPLEGGQSRTLRPALAGVKGLVWGPNDTSLFIFASDDRGKPASYRIDLSTAEVHTMDVAQGSLVSPHGHWLFRPGGADTAMGGRPTRVIANGVPNGEERELYVAPASHDIASGLVISPDGRSIVFSVEDRGDHGKQNKPFGLTYQIMVISTEGGSPRELLAPEALLGRFHVPLGFTPDGQAVLVRGSQPPADSKSDPRTTQHLWRVPLAGGKPTEIELGHSDFGDVRLSPDGRGLAFIAGKVAAELWVLDDPHLGFGTAGHDGARRK